MKEGTALRKASGLPLPGYAHDALRYDRHPQDRTHAFHMFYGAPIHHGRPTMSFDYMSDQRAAFRAAFVLNEAIELIEKGLGVKLPSIGDGTNGPVGKVLKGPNYMEPNLATALGIFQE
jgi:hypothetical protein